jgi:formamidopyrimidine-DNA glycosylase
LPELPEVETVRRGLEARLPGRRIVAVDQRRPDLRIAFPPDFAGRLTDRRIERLDRRAKYLLIRLDRGLVWIVHLGMSGRLGFVEAAHADDPCADPHAHVVVTFDGGLRLVYRDARRFGLMTLAVEDELAAHPLLGHLGLEPLDPQFDGAALAGVLAGRQTSLKAALLDQRRIAGIGNIYACEALFRAGLSPQRPAGALTGREAGRLAKAIRAVLTEAIAAGGSSLRDYVHADGGLGYFQHRFAVYDREGSVCPKPGCGGTVGRLVQSNRSTFFCATCQH